MLPPDLVEVIEQDHRALDAIVRGDQGPKKAVFSHRDDVTLANPLGPPARGWDQVEKTLEFERWRGKAGSSDEIVPMALRVTTIFRREDGVWKIALRQPIRSRLRGRSSRSAIRRGDSGCLILGQGDPVDAGVRSCAGAVAGWRPHEISRHR
jgi:hypothetical protein